jgi:hypothetical protein
MQGGSSLAQLRTKSLTGLQCAVAREAKAAARLADALQAMRRAMEGLDMPLLERELDRARSSANELAQAGSTCVARAEPAARAMGLRGEPGLAEVIEALGTGGDEASRGVRGLQETLGALARELAAVSIAARYGAGLWAHLVGLRRCDSPSYGPTGRLHASVATRCRTV